VGLQPSNNAERQPDLPVQAAADAEAAPIFARYANVEVIDMGRFLDQGSLASDGVHPNDRA
jgi:hypothetical protein